MTGKAVTAKPVGLLLLVGLGSGAVLGADESKLKTSKDYHYLPNNPVLIASFRLDQITESSAYKDIQMEKSNLIKDMENKVGLGPDDVARLMVAIGNSGQNMIYVITTKKPVTARDLTAKMKEEPFLLFGKPKLVDRKSKEVKVGNYTVDQSERKGTLAVCVIDANTVVYGEMKYLQPVLERNKAVEVSADMKKALELVDQAKPAFMVLNTKGFGTVMDKRPGLVQNAQVYEAIAISASFDSAVQLRVTALCKDAATAESQKQELTRVIEGSKTFVSSFWNANLLKEELTKTLDGIKIDTDGTKLTGTVMVNPAKILATLAQPASAPAPNERPGKD